MIRGYVSSDEDDDYDFGYSEPLVRRQPSPTLPSVQNKEFREVLHSALETSKKISLFLKAVNEGDLNTLEELISLGVGVDDSGPQEWTPLMKACGIGRCEVVQFLLEHGSDPNLHKELFTPLMACCTHSLIDEGLKLNCVRLLLQHGAKVNMTDKYKTTALMYAIKSGYVDIANELLSIPDIDINIQDKEGWNALFYAVNSNSLDLIRKLIEAGTDLTVKDRYNRTALYLAIDKELKEAAELLGYVEEEISANLDRNEQIYMNFINELPSPNGEGGFPTEAQMMISLFTKTQVPKLSLPDLLNITDKDLYDLGVKIKHVRHKILTEGIHRYHLHPWNACVKPINVTNCLSMEDTVALMGNLLKDITIGNASLRYLNTRISNWKNINPDNAVEKELINVLVSYYSLMAQVKLKLNKICNEIDKIELQFPGDYVAESHTHKRQNKLVKYFWYTLSGTTAGLLLYYFKYRTLS